MYKSGRLQGICPYNASYINRHIYMHRPAAHKYNVYRECAHLCILSRGSNATICTSSSNKLCKPKTVQDLTISARKSSMSNGFKALERFCL